MSRRLRYGVAVSLDGFIAGPHGEYDWIVSDPSIDFGAMYKQFDTAVMGRKTYDLVAGMREEAGLGGLEVVVFSRTLRPATKPRLRILNDDPAAVVADLKSKPGRDIWLFGGGELCRTLLDAGLVDSIEVAVIPVVVSAGIPLVAPGGRAKLVLSDHKILPESGIVMLSYALENAVGPAPRIGYIRPRTSRKRTAARRVKRSAASKSSRRAR